MTVLPKKPYSVGGCSIDQTQTTDSMSYQGLVCPTTPSQRQALGDGDTLVLPVHAVILRQHRAAKGKRTEHSHAVLTGRAGQRAGTVPTSTNPTVIRISSTYLFYHMGRDPEILRCPRPRKGTALSSQSAS